MRGPSSLCPDISTGFTLPVVSGLPVLGHSKSGFDGGLKESGLERVFFLSLWVRPVKQKK